MSGLRFFRPCPKARTTEYWRRQIRLWSIIGLIIFFGGMFFLLSLSD